MNGECLRAEEQQLLNGQHELEYGGYDAELRSDAAGRLVW
jgi:hypothetical protein